MVARTAEAAEPPWSSDHLFDQIVSAVREADRRHLRERLRLRREIYLGGSDVR